MQTLQANILRRALGDKGFDSIIEQYKEARLRGRTVRKPSQNDQRIYQRFLALKSLRQTAEAFPGVTEAKVAGAITRVAAWQKNK